MNPDIQPMVLTLDAGGTTFSFSSIDSRLTPSTPLVIPSEPQNLSRCLEQIIFGFEELIKTSDQPILAISFAFPGPADYLHGVIGDLGNLPAFRGGIPLAAILENHFQLPVFINNDGNLFAYGEAMAGFLPEINKQLKNQGQTRQYQNLFGVTLGTGFGGGIIINKQMVAGDCSAAGEIWLMRQKQNPHLNVEEAISIRALQRNYRQLSGISADHNLSPKEIYLIAEGQFAGDEQAAKGAFTLLGEALGDALANAVTLIDGAIVIGGGLSGAATYFMPAVLKELNGRIGDHPRLESTVFNMDDPHQAQLFLNDSDRQINYPGLTKPVNYIWQKRIPMGISRLGTSRAVAVGAYYFSIIRLSNRTE